MIQKLLVENVPALAAVRRPADALPDYRPPPGRFDELAAAEGELKNAWLQMLTDRATLERIDRGDEAMTALPGRVAERWRSVRHWLQEHQASPAANSFAGHASSWELDPIPLLVLQEDWAELKRAIGQRARLIDAVVRDLYGPQRLLLDGTIPPELVYGSPYYLPSMRGSIRAGEPAIYLYAAQMCRDRGGRWMAIADRTQGPSGCGYTIENRIALSRVLASEFKEMHVQRSAKFFATLRATIAAYAAMRQPNSQTVLLSPGVRSDTFFEDAYLARYLGYTLTQAEDLTVRGGLVYQKTLGGLMRVQSVLRRLQDDQCDPLELGGRAGVPGLCQAAREGAVALVNPIGCGWAEMPAVAAIMPLLCKRVLGEELLLPSAPAEWCGDEDSRRQVLERLDELEVRDALRRREHAGAVHPPGRTAAANKSLAAAIRAEPWKYVASEPREYSTAPVWQNDRLSAWPAVVRGFAALAEGGDYYVLDGGIARLAPEDGALGESLRAGAVSKDVWVVGKQPPEMLTLRRPVKTSIELRRSSFELPSRVAENLYWLGRGTQRVEGFVRHARCSAQRLGEESDLHLAACYAAIFDALDPREDQGWDLPRPTAERVLGTIERRLRELLFGESPSGLPSMLRSIRHNAISVRDRLSVDSYHLLEKLAVARQEGGGRQGPAGKRQTAPRGEEVDFADGLSATLLTLSAFSGLVAENMTRGPGWLFLDIGVRVERVLHQLQVMRSFLMYDYVWMTPLLEAILDIMDSSMTYRFRYLMNLEIDPVIDLLLIDETNPRAIAFQLARLDELTESLAAVDATGLASQRTWLAECRGAIRLVDAESLSLLHEHESEAAVPLASAAMPAPPPIEPSAIDLPTIDLPTIDPATIDPAPAPDGPTPLHETFPEMLASPRQRHSLRLLLDRIEYVIAGLHDYMSERFFIHTAGVQRLDR